MSSLEFPDEFDKLLSPLDPSTQQVREDFEVTQRLLQSSFEILSNLRINPYATRLFSMRFLDHPVFMFACLHNIRIKKDESEEVIPGQRIIVNRSETETDHLSTKYTIHDYLLCYRSDAILMNISEVELQETPTRMWDTTTQKGPLLLVNGDEVKVHVGKEYTCEQLDGVIMSRENINAARSLLSDLRDFSPGCEDDIRSWKFITH